MTAEPMYELEISRIFNAPRDLVYQAFTDPDQLAQWFGPIGWVVPRDTVEVDARPGGHQRFVMVNADDSSQRSPVSATFTQVVTNELLVGEQSVEGIPGFEGMATMTLRLEFHEEPGGKTRLELRQGPFTHQLEERSREGWNSSFGKLDDLLAAGA
jgi:uncharacterized protein YndB with AHSA1/START domain